MWSPWLRSPSHRVHNASAHPSTFTCSSFKDVQTLCKEDEDEEEQQQQSHHLLRRRHRSIFHLIRLSAAVLRHWSDPNPPIFLPGTENRVVLYTTTLRVVRKTFDDCRAVRSILRGFPVSIDDRDLSMDPRFLGELQRILDPATIKSPTLPRVFIGGRYVGGAEEIGRLHESGELKRLIQGLPLAKESGGGGCGTCVGHRFVLCDDCSGSHKAYDERIGFRICSTCNENGLIRCPFCVSPDLF